MHISDISLSTIQVAAMTFSFSVLSITDLADPTSNPASTLSGVFSCLLPPVPTVRFKFNSCTSYSVCYRTTLCSLVPPFLVLFSVSILTSSKTYKPPLVPLLIPQSHLLRPSHTSASLFLLLRPFLTFLFPQPSAGAIYTG